MLQESVHEEEAEWIIAGAEEASATEGISMPVLMGESCPVWRREVAVGFSHASTSSGEGECWRRMPSSEVML
jgi:hypothetical protein